MQGQADRHRYRGRFAPSPTGPLHFGSLVAAVGGFLEARSRGGEWLVRMEDLDRPRERPGMATHILRTLEQFGLCWDGEVLYQSRRSEFYREILDRLRRDERTYPCACSRREISANARHVGPEGPVYPGTCRERRPSGRKALAIRFIASSDLTCFDDSLQGRICQSVSRDVGDFVIRRADGLFAYQLAVVIDDADQGITDIVRGADLLDSTPRQIQLQRALQIEQPAYCHLPLVLDAQGRKLSKQEKAHPVNGLDPLPALLDALAFLGQPLPPETPSSLAELWQWALKYWDLSRVPRARSRAE